MDAKALKRDGTWRVPLSISFRTGHNEDIGIENTHFWDFKAE
jgi:hypothetical protein